MGGPETRQSDGAAAAGRPVDEGRRERGAEERRAAEPPAVAEPPGEAEPPARRAVYGRRGRGMAAPASPAAADDLQGRVLRAQAVILQHALRVGVKVSFGEGRRRADVAMVLLKGDREAVLALPSRLEDELDFDLHVLRSTFVRESFELLMVFMERVDEQALRSPERRAYLRPRLQHAAVDEEGQSLLEGDASLEDEAPT